MKIITWNVNGVRAALGKGFKQWMMAQSPDVMCVQEIKARPEQLTDEQREFPNYGVTWNSAERPGYSGVATFYRTPPLNIQTGLGVDEFDVEGRVILTRHPGFLLYNIYFPNGQRGHDRVEYKLRFYQRLLQICDQLHTSGENIIITGDFNIAHQPIDLRNPEENMTTSGFLPEERAWVDAFLAHGFVDVYRYLYPTREQYTWWTYRFAARQRNIGWRIDYFLVSSALLGQVCDVVIHDSVAGSDHCPVELTLA